MNFDKNGNIETAFELQNLDKTLMNETLKEFKMPKSTSETNLDRVAKLANVQRVGKIWQPDKLLITRKMKLKLAFIEEK